jgi:hypothetical protein
LPNGERRQEERNKPVLTPRQSVRRMPRDLEQKVSVSPLVKDLPRARPLHGEAAENKRARGEAQILIRLLPFQANTGDGVGAAELLLGD